MTVVGGKKLEVLMRLDSKSFRELVVSKVIEQGDLITIVCQEGEPVNVPSP